MELEFTNEDLVLRATDEPGWWRTVEPLEYCDRDLLIQVPKGFVTDLASVPRLLWWILPPFGHYTAAAVVHDWLYSTQAVGGRRLKRKTADKVFLRAMKDLGVRWTRRHAMYRAVRLFGWWPWLRKPLTEI